MGKAILALDQGTTSSRAILFDRQGHVMAVAQREFPQYFPQPGWVEHDLEEIWQSQLATAREVLKAAGLGAGDVHAIGITNQRETAALWERATGKPVARAIVWQCRRTAARCEAIRAAGDEPMLRERTGLVADAYFSATKWEWLLDAEPDLRRRAEKGELACGTIDSWLAFRLSGGALHITDPGNAGRTLLFGLEAGGWDGELLDYFRIPAGLLPEVVPSSARYGETEPGLLGGAIPIAGIAGDQQAALFGQGCHRPGEMKNTYGTGGFLLVNTGKTPGRSETGLLTSPAWRIGGATHFALEGSVFIAGAAVQWLRDGLGIIAEAGETEALAASVPDTGGVSFVPAFVGLGAPHWNAEARGALVGLTRGTTRAHVARAALEAIALQTMELVEVVGRDLGGRPPMLRVDGGAAANNFLCQFQADLLGLPVERPAVLETTAAGAAYLAGLATGFWDSLEEVGALRRAERVFEPARSEDWRQSEAARWAKAVARATL